MMTKINPIISPSSKIWFIQNTSSEGPGYLSELLSHWKIKHSVCNLAQGDPLPNVRGKDAVIVLGGPMSANDTTHSMRELLSWTRMLLEKNTPYLGICLGLQTLVKAAGGKVVKSPVKEIGLKMNDHYPFTCVLTTEGRNDLLFTRFQKNFPVFQLHGETVELTDDMVLLAKGKWCHNQIVKVGQRAYGVQGHLELTTSLLVDWLANDEDLHSKDPEKLLKDWFRAEKEHHYYCRKILLNFLKVAEIVG